MTSETTILVVDDDELIRIATRSMLSQHGFQVLEAVDGHDALRMQREQPAELWLLDICMPNCDGLEAIQLLRKENTSLPVICMSTPPNTNEIDYTKIAVKFGANLSLYKPFTEKQLLAAINSLQLP